MMNFSSLKAMLFKTKLRKVIFFIISFLIVSVSYLQFHQKAIIDNPPNIIFIVADDLGWKDLGIYGNKDINTPNIDALATSGMRFNNAFVAAPSCASSRAALITGQYPHTNKVTGLTHRYPSKSLKPFYTTLPSVLRGHGYNTAIDGKWHIAPYYPSLFYGYKHRMTGMGVFKGDWHIKNSDDALGFIKNSVADNKPFYLELNFLQNHRIEHGKFYYSPDFPVNPDKINVPEYYNLPDLPEIREDVAKFYSQTMEMDYIIGEVVQALDKLNISESTMIVFVSDNGPPYPGAKMTLYDRGIGTPLIINWPNKIMANTQENVLVNSIDIMPSILQAANIAIPENVQGQSFMPLLISALDSNGYIEQKQVFSELDYHVNYLPSRSVRTKKWKYIKNYSDDMIGLDELDTTPWATKLSKDPKQLWMKPRVQEELYYLIDDPNENINLINHPQYQNKLNELRASLTKHLRETDDPFLEQAFTYSSK